MSEAVAYAEGVRALAALEAKRLEARADELAAARERIARREGRIP